MELDDVVEWYEIMGTVFVVKKKPTVADENLCEMLKDNVVF